MMGGVFSRVREQHGRAWEPPPKKGGVGALLAAGLASSFTVVEVSFKWIGVCLKRRMTVEE
jgi:hypothetical protein